MRELLWVCLWNAMMRDVSGEKSCPRLSVSEVGFNYVQFKGDLHRVRAIQLSRGGSGASLIDRPIFYKFGRELPGKGILPPFSNIVPLLQRDGFKIGRWYLVCGASAEVASESCEECVVVRRCHCDCHRGPDLFLNLTTGKVPVKDKWNSLGVMVGWAADDLGPLKAYVDASVTWDPYDCDGVPGQPDLCKRPFLSNRGHIRGNRGSETFTVDKAQATLVMLDYDIVIDLASLRKAHPNYHLPDTYVFHRGPFEFRRVVYRQLSNTGLPIPFPHNERPLEEIQATCRLIHNELDSGSLDDTAYDAYTGTSDTLSSSLLLALPALLALLLS